MLKVKALLTLEGLEGIGALFWFLGGAIFEKNCNYEMVSSERERS